MTTASAGADLEPNDDADQELSADSEPAQHERVED